jgi:hypothetical protein
VVETRAPTFDIEAALEALFLRPPNPRGAADRPDRQAMPTRPGEAIA